MPEFEPDKESISRAEALASLLMDDLRMVSENDSLSRKPQEIFSEGRYSKLAEGVPINDVVTNVGQMATEFAMARRWDNELLCLKLDDGGFAPISMMEYLGAPLWPSYGLEDWLNVWESNFRFPPHHFWRDILHSSEKQEERLTVANVREAEEGVERGLGDFLSYRFIGMKKWTEWIQGTRNRLLGGSKGASGGVRGGSSSPPPPPAVGPGGGLQVQVSCLTPGLRIHVSPAYFIRWVFFGSPTTPVSSYLLPGRYVFAGDGPMLPKRTRDHGVFSIPPTYHAALTRF